tara:strand:- start:1099 stop:1959 length:861 start_codon:yes stop_codon:yes gene_type:complete
LVLFAAVWFAVGLRATGLEIRLQTLGPEFLPNEPLAVGVSIKNFSGRPVILGQHREWIRFLIMDVQGRPVVKGKDPPAGEIFIVPNGKTVVKWIDLAPFFNVRQPGTYSITGRVNVRQWRQDVDALPCQIKVTAGMVLAAHKFGVPDKNNIAKPPEIRVFKLLRKRADGRLLLYLRVAEENDYAVYTVRQLGPMVQLSPPEFQLDQSGRIHVFFRSGASRYTYCVADADGVLEKRQSYETYLRKRPMMRMSDKGVLEIRGGRRVFSYTDFPAAPPPPRRELPPLRD